MPQSDAFSDLDLDSSEQGSDPSLTSFADDGTNAGLNYDQGDAVTSFSADRAEQASDAEWSSLEHGDSNRVMKMKVLSNVLERDAPLDFSLSSNTTPDSRAKASPSPAINFTPLGDLPATPAVPTNIAEAFAAAQFQKARNLFSIGMTVDPQHGPLYHAYGNMELVSMHTSSCVNVSLSCLIFDSLNAFSLSSLATRKHNWGERRVDAWYRHELQRHHFSVPCMGTARN